VSDFVPLGIDQFFDEHTIAVYLKERVCPSAKKGTINDMKLVKIREQPTSEYELRALAQEILERAKRDPDGFIEVEKAGDHRCPDWFHADRYRASTILRWYGNHRCSSDS
jgi:ATPase